MGEAQGAAAEQDLVDVHIPLSSRAGILEEVTNLAYRLRVQILDLEIIRATSTDRGVLVVMMSTSLAPTFVHARSG
jgi:hypothetical protein